jgi:hypothetical protein
MEDYPDDEPWCATVLELCCITKKHSKACTAASPYACTLALFESSSSQQGTFLYSTRFIHAAVGVRSGTGIVDELLLQRIHRIVKELHMLCISQEGAARIVSRMASKLDHGDFQQLQVHILVKTVNDLI